MPDAPCLYTVPSLTGYTRTLTIDHTQVPSTQSDFPVLVNFTDLTFRTEANGGHVKATNAFTFSSDSGGSSLLKWEVERYNASTGEIIAWVKIASVSSVSDTVFYLRYGTGITTDQSDPPNVWTNNFVQVAHLKDGTTINTNDSVHAAAPYNFDSGTGLLATAGQIDGGGQSSNAHESQDQGFVWPTGAITLSCWANGSSFPNGYQAPISRLFGAPTEYAVIYVKSTGKLACYVNATNARSYDGTGSNTLSSGTWYYLALTYDSSAGLVGYVNGASDGTATANGAYAHANSQVGYIGDFNGNYFTGSIDEARFASVVRSGDWLLMEYNNQKTSQTFVALGPET